MTGSPAGAVTVKLTEQFPNGTGQFESRARPAAVNGWLNVGRARLLLRWPRTEMRRAAAEVRKTRSPLLLVTRTWPSRTGALNATE